MALVAGATGGIGRACALRLAAEGARVGALARSADTLETLVGEIEAAGGRAVPLTADVRQAAQVENAIEALVDAFGGLDSVVNATGVAVPNKRVVDLAEEDWDTVIDTNLKGCFLIARHSVPFLRARGGGAIVNLSSAAGTMADAGESAYCSSKAAINMLTRVVALETAKEGIRCNVVAPSIVRTPMIEAECQRSELGPEAYERMLERITPLGRLVKPGEVANLVLYLLSEEAAAITGGVHSVDGGWTAQINVGEIS